MLIDLQMEAIAKKLLQNIYAELCAVMLCTYAIHIQQKVFAAADKQMHERLLHIYRNAH